MRHAAMCVLCVYVKFLCTLGLACNIVQILMKLVMGTAAKHMSKGNGVFPVFPSNRVARAYFPILCPS